MSERAKQCRYCGEDADVCVQGWRHGPPDVLEGAKADVTVYACGVHRLTAKLRVTSAGFDTALQTETEIGTWFAPGYGPDGKKDKGDGT